MTERLPLVHHPRHDAPVAPRGGWVLWWRTVARTVVAPRERARSDQALVAWLDAAARSVRSGASLRQALSVAGAVVEGSSSPPDLALLGADLDGGEPLDRALDRFVSRCPTPTRILAGRSISLAGETGGRPAQLLEGVAATVRDRLALGREARALATQARASAVVIVIAPIGFALVGVSVDGRVASFLFGSLPGIACVVVGLVLEAVGAWWMARLVGRCT